MNLTLIGLVAAIVVVCALVAARRGGPVLASKSKLEAMALQSSEVYRRTHEQKRQLWLADKFKHQP